MKSKSFFYTQKKSKKRKIYSPYRHTEPVRTPKFPKLIYRTRDVFDCEFLRSVYRFITEEDFYIFVRMGTTVIASKLWADRRTSTVT